MTNHLCRGPCNGKGCRPCHLAAFDPRRAAMYGRTRQDVNAWLACNEWARTPPNIKAPVRRKATSRFQRPACQHLGRPTGRQVPCKECTKTTLQMVHECGKHGTCTIAKLAPGVECCQICKDYERPAPKSKLEWISTRKLAGDTLAYLMAKLPPNLAGIVAVPRSGSAPAAILACQMHLPLYTLRGGRIEPAGQGGRGRQGWAGERNGPLLFVDDSAYSGNTARRLRKQFPDAKIAAVYTRAEAAGTLDYFGRIVESPHLMEWNLFNGPPLIGRTINPVMHGGCALDFDGILCHDPPFNDVTDEPRYRQWLIDAPPLHLPRRHVVPLIVTFRLEKYRPETQAWLDKWGVKVERLVMHPAATAAERNRTWDVAAHKGEAFRQSTCAAFIESSSRQAKVIFDTARKPVICPPIEEVFQ